MHPSEELLIRLKNLETLYESNFGSVRPKCSHRCVSLKESPLKPVPILKHTTRISTEQTCMRTKWFQRTATNGANGRGQVKCQKSVKTSFDMFRQSSHRAKGVKKRRKHVSMIFAQHHFSGPFWFLGGGTNNLGEIAQIGSSKSLVLKSFLGEETLWDSSLLVTLQLLDAPVLFTPPLPLPQSTLETVFRSFPENAFWIAAEALPTN